MKTLALTFAFFIASFTISFVHAQTLAPLSNTVILTVDNEDGTIAIEWNTLKENNTRYFLIEKSYDGIHYSYVGTKQAGGNTAFPRSYSFNDLEDATQVSYRVTLVLMDGGLAVSAPVSLHTLSDNADSNIAKK